ncbi:MAG: tripartite tricarboxylate transporter substrate binding protein [Burkholderiales bacterium]|nr:tripartite tricarboxylate transporter substrate binding protein [Burkholderiales bacterium]
MKLSARAGVGALALFILGIGSGVSHALETPYPTRPVRLIVPFPPGGSTDAMARILSPKMAEAMGQSWVVDNRGGAGGNLAAEYTARASPDGHTVLIALNTQLTAAPSLYKLPFNVEKDLQPITMTATHEHIVLVPPAFPAKTFKEFVSVAQHKGGKLTYGTSGVGGSLHLAAELLKRRAGFDMMHVPYKGAGPAIAALLGGEVNLMVGAVPSTIAHVNAGRLRALATTGPVRHKVTPAIPTIAELGYPEFENVAWFALLVPSATPKHVSARILQEAHKAIQQPEVSGAMSRLGLDPKTTTAQQLAAIIKAETALLATVIREAGIKGE